MSKATHTERAHSAGQRRHDDGQDNDAAHSTETAIESYVRLVRAMDTVNRAWLGTMRQSLDAGYTLAQRLSQALIEDNRRLTENWLRLYIRDGQAGSAMTGEATDRTAGPGSRVHSMEDRTAHAAD